MSEAAEQFGPFDGRAWFNTAHQGPLPQSAVAASQRAAWLKAAPYRITDEEFSDVPEQLRGLLARLVGADAEQIVLGNSTSHGLHLIANGLDWADGDEVLIIEGDYPATMLPWLRLASAGVTTRALRPAAGLLSAEQLTSAIGPQTRLVAVTWVDSFTGRTLDLDALGEVCRQQGVLLVVNASQALGARPIDVTTAPVDAVVSCGYKWLCGPYGTGFAWVHPDLLGRLRPQQAYWLAMQAGRGLDQMRETTLRDDLGVRAFDVFCPAAFTTTLPWIASLELVLATGVAEIGQHDQQLVEQFVARLDAERYTLVSPRRGASRSTLVVMSCRDRDTEQLHQQLTAAGIDTAYREGNLRFSIHLFNTSDEVDHALSELQH
ncbi:MAG TPA: aminotransferase class V-fold PLP-dependent enzyme [Streptosporangiaceae bacterium]